LKTTEEVKVPIEKPSTQKQAMLNKAFDDLSSDSSGITRLRFQQAIQQRQ
jgi:hypothetical protein